MPQFAYKARKSGGQIESGRIEASERRVAMQRLRAQGLTPVSIKATGGDSGHKNAFAGFGKLLRVLNPAPTKAKEQGEVMASKSGGQREKVGLAVLKRLMELHGSGLPAGDSIRILSQRLSQKEQKTLATELWKDLSEGATLAGAMARQPKYFSGSVCYVIEAGEATGNLTPILHKVIEYLEEKQEIRQKMLTSMAYPGFICTVAIGVVVLFMTVLLPRIQGMLTKLGGEMTWSARILIDGSSLVAQLGPFILVALIIGILGFQQWRRSATGLRITDRWLLRLPLIGRIIFYADLFQAGSLVSTLLESGINTTETLRLSERTIQNTTMRDRFHLARGQVNEGLSIAQAFSANHFMPDLAVDILTVGEDTGNLGRSMDEVTRGFRDELTKRLNLLTQVVSGGALGGAFLLVTLIALGIVTSVFQVSQNL